MSKLHGYLCLPRVYSWRGWTWEDGMYSGPWPLRKDWEPRARAGRVFWRVWGEWLDMSEEEQKKTRIGGGCVRF